MGFPLGTSKRRVRDDSSPDFGVETFGTTQHSRLVPVAIGRYRDPARRRRMNRDDWRLAHDLNGLVERRVGHVVVEID